MSRQAGHPGFTLVELLVALAIGAVLLSAGLRVVLAAASGFRLQQALAQVQEDGRYALGAIEAEVRAAGFHPRPWETGFSDRALASGTVEAYTERSDRLVLRRLSDRNCHDRPNPVSDADGRPAHYLLEQGFHADSEGDLVWRCRYGPEGGPLVTQVNNFGLAEGVEAFQVRYAEDRDQDGLAERWVDAGGWQVERDVRAVHLALLLASKTPVGAEQAPVLRVLGEIIVPPADRRLRQLFESTVLLRGREG